jgi:hypothetical protein
VWCNALAMPRNRAKSRRAKKTPDRAPPPGNPQAAVSVARLGSVAALAFVMVSLPVVLIIGAILSFVFDVV